MKYIFIFFIFTSVYFFYEYFKILKTYKLSQEIVKNTIAFQNITNDTSVSLLVLGDSTAFGVGAGDPLSSVPALFADYVGATYVENHSVSGAKIEDLKAQIEKIKLEKYNYILVQIGGNNIVARQDAQSAAIELLNIYKLLPESGQTIHICCGNVGDATALPWFVRPYYTSKTLDYHTAFEKLNSENNVGYINLFDSKEVDPFLQNPNEYLATDGFHPSALGYEYWFAKIKEANGDNENAKVYYGLALEKYNQNPNYISREEIEAELNKKIISYNDLEFHVIKTSDINSLINDRTTVTIWEEEVSNSGNFMFSSSNQSEKTGKYHFLFQTDVTEKMVGVSEDNSKTFNVPWKLLREVKVGDTSFMVLCGLGDPMSVGHMQFECCEIGIRRNIFEIFISQLMASDPDFFSLYKMRNVIGLENFDLQE